MKAIAATTVADAWVHATQHLMARANWSDMTVVLQIDEPTLVRTGDQNVRQELDDFLSVHDSFSNHTVAETIFPGHAYLRHGVDGVYNVYPDRIYPHLKSHPHTRRWGTYAYRILRRNGPDGAPFNPLEGCIQKMKDAKPKRAAYEV